MTMITYNDFFPENVLSLTTDRSFDFTQKGPAWRLSNEQKDFLGKSIGLNISDEVNVRQVHSDNIVVVDKDYDGGIIEADGIVSDQIDVPIVIRTADCLPVFIYESKKRCMGLVHCGWRSTQKKIVRNAISLMKDRFGCDVNDIRAAFGPCIRECCYQVSEEFSGFFKNAQKKNDKFHFDLAGENKDQLRGSGIDLKNIYDRGTCTCCNEDYFSFRRDGERSGRMLSLMMMRP